MEDEERRYTVIDNVTGRRGHLDLTEGYVLGSHYVNPQYIIVWDDEEDED